MVEIQQSKGGRINMAILKLFSHQLNVVDK